jgi:hypothetical protein
VGSGRPTFKPFQRTIVVTGLRQFVVGASYFQSARETPRIAGIKLLVKFYVEFQR